MEDFDLLEWDSVFFGYKIAAIKPYDLSLQKLNRTVSVLKENHFRLAYCFVNPGDKTSNDVIKNASGYLADEKVTYFKNTNETSSLQDLKNISPYNLSYVSEKLKSLTLASGIYSRFKLDPGFHNNEFEKLYLEWIQKSVDRILATEVFVYSEEQDIQGFITMSYKNNTGSIGLIAVDESQRGKSIGKKLINAALLYFKDKEISNVEVVTQKANLMACRFYESCSFELKSIVNVYHLWIR